jgi:hypothetical protein
MQQTFKVGKFTADFNGHFYIVNHESKVMPIALVYWHTTQVEKFDLCSDTTEDYYRILLKCKIELENEKL